MMKAKPYYLSEDIDPDCWESMSDAYNDLSVYAYQFIEYKSDKYPIPEELVGDAVLKACERAFKYRDNFDIELGKLHNWFNMIIIHVLNAIFNKLPNDQRLDAMINKAVTDFETDYDLDPDEPESEDDTEGSFEVGASPEHNMLVGEVQRIRKEVAEALNQHINNLKPLDREIFTKAYIDDIPFKVIASQTGLTETAARKRAFDIKNRIRHALPAITPWKAADIVLYNKMEEFVQVPMLLPEEELLLKLFPQYDTRSVEPDDKDTAEYENMVAAHELLRSHLEMCFDDYKVQTEVDIDIYSELKAELSRRGRNIREDDRLDSNMFILEDNLDIIVSGPGCPVLYIGFIHEFITIYTSRASAASIADYIDDLHTLIDSAGDEIDSLIDIRA
ncbi:MAG: sigma-70 family RNA polymerase sigma factor [Bacteroidales bacterium]|nr:sigma-70 family RNA polymerase sigma factor [Bacteroidales bacterium]MBR5300640.1 sigma-70 family RNA polymerase sigma factor [Bacteroidales bacterium]